MPIQIGLRHFFEPSIARAPNAREREVLAARLQRLGQMEQSVAAAGQGLQELLARRATPAGDIRLRRRFVRLDDPDPAAETTTRNVTTREQRPPSTRLMSPRGRALSFLLIALFEAQMRLGPGQVAVPNTLALKSEDNKQPAWSDFIATDAQPALEGRVFVGVPTKKARQIQSALTRLHGQHLIHLPVRGRQRRFEDFMLMREDARSSGDNSHYRVPENGTDFFTVPVSLFTKGWIHVLEDSELALLLIAAYMYSLHGDQPVPLRSGPRKLNYGLSRDSFEAGHRMLDYLGILDVISDWRRSEDGKVGGFSDRGAKPHELRFHPEVLDQPAHPTIVEVITKQLARPEAP